MSAMREQSRASGENERYRTLLEINNALVANLTRDALFHAIAGALRRVVPFERTAIFLHDPDKGVLKLYILESSLTSPSFSVGLEMAAEIHERRAAARAAAARALRGHPAPRGVLPRPLRPEVRQADRDGVADHDGAPRRVRVAGQYPRAAERDRARRRAVPDGSA